MKLDVESMVVDGQLDLDYLEKIVPTFVPNTAGKFTFVFNLKEWKVIITASSYYSGYYEGWRPEDIKQKIRIRVTLWGHLRSIYDYVSQDDDDKLIRVKGISIESSDMIAHRKICKGLEYE